MDGKTLASALKRAGITHVVWLPDTELGAWDRALATESELRLIRVCREGEAVGVAAGLLLGGQRPLVIIQCTGMFEAGDALRNVVHDLKLPLFMLVGVRSYQAYKRGNTTDTCPVFAEAILRAWQLPFSWLEPNANAEDVARAYTRAWSEKRAGAVLLPE